MQMMTVKQLAQKHGVSYEAMRKTVDRNREALKGHVVTRDRTRYIDEEGIRILEEERRKSKVVVIREDHADEIARLTGEVEQLKAQLLAAQNEVIKAKDAQLEAQNRIIELQSTAQEALTMREDLEQAREEVDAIRREAAERKAEDAGVIGQLMQERNAAREEAAAAKAEAASFRPSWFGFYRKG